MNTIPIFPNDDNAPKLLEAKIAYTSDQKISVEANVKKYAPRDKKMFVSVNGFLELMLGNNKYSKVSRKDLAILAIIIKNLKINNPVLSLTRKALLTHIKTHYLQFSIDQYVLSKSISRLKKAGLLKEDPDSKQLIVNADLFCKGSLTELHNQGYLEA